MPAAPAPGMKFVQEVAPGIAEDQAAIVGANSETVPAGTFEDTIRVKETNPLDGGKGYKTYAEGVGLIVDGPVRLVSSTLLATAAAPIPREPQEPPAAGSAEPLPETGEETPPDSRPAGGERGKSAPPAHGRKAGAGRS